MGWALLHEYIKTEKNSPAKQKQEVAVTVKL